MAEKRCLKRNFRFYQRGKSIHRFPPLLPLSPALSFSVSSDLRASPFISPSNPSPFSLCPFHRTHALCLPLSLSRACSSAVSSFLLFPSPFLLSPTLCLPVSVTLADSASIFHFPSPSCPPFPPLFPDASCSSQCPDTCSCIECQDQGSWVDTDNLDCASYVSNNYCLDGGIGPSWSTSWGTFEDYAVDGVSAAQACCECGGGSLPQDWSLSTSSSGVNVESADTHIFELVDEDATHFQDNWYLSRYVSCFVLSCSLLSSWLPAGG